MSIAGVGGSNQEKNSKNVSVGHVAFRKSKNQSSQNESPSSWAVDEEQRIPIHSQQDEGFSDSYIRSPPRIGSQRSSRRRGTPSSRASTLDDVLSLPPEIPEEEENETSFKSWLTSGILGGLNVVAGITLSTTGQIMAPPLHVTKTVLLPGLLALFIDTFDATAPQRVKDWFRILSSSVYHLFSVLRSTSSGQKFSSQFWTVLQDIIGVLSSPETRQVLVDGVACSVKLADALNTPEVHAWMDHSVLLGCRLVDAASSGKAKQFLHDAKDLAWNGIEMATDPTTTLALAEVTAHLCYALEDAQHSLVEPNKRAQRNAQNQSTYIDPLQMSDLPQVPIETIILNCLGIDDEGDQEAGGSVPSDVVWNVEAPIREVRDWKARDRVDTRLLREKIFQPSRTPRSHQNSHSSAVSIERPSTVSSPTLDTVPVIHSGSDEDQQGTSHSESAEPKLSSVNAGTLNKNDIEDIILGRIPERKKSHKGPEKIQGKSARESASGPGVLKFYRLLDDLLEQNKATRQDWQQGSKSKIKTPQISNGEKGKDPWKLVKANVKKLKAGAMARTQQRNALREKEKNRFHQLPTRQKQLVAVAAMMIGSFCLCFIGFGVYGMYTFSNNFRSFGLKKRVAVDSHESVTSPSGAANSEVVIRIVREVVHVREDGTVLKSSPGSSFSNDEMDTIADCLSSSFEEL